MGPGAPASAFGTPNAMLAHPIQDVRLLLGEASPGTNHAATAAVRYPRATAPRPFPFGPYGPVLNFCVQPTGVLEK